MEAIRKAFEEAREWGVIQPEDNHPDRKTDNKTSSSIAKKRPDYNKFEANNWIKKEKELLKEIDDKGCSLWITPEVKIAYKINNKTNIVEPHKAKIVLSNILDKKIDVFGQKESSDNIEDRDLILIQDEVFEPHINKEFYYNGKFWIRNTFKPTHYMKLMDKPHKEPTNILRFISHLLNEYEERVDYFINWLSYFWQTLKRPVTAVAIKGTQGTGKGILFEKIIQELFGREQSIQINDNILKSHFLAPVFQGSIFYNLDEISQGVSDNKRLKGMLKGLTTNDTILLEEKHKNIKEPIQLKGAVLITSNEPKFLEIEPNDRRYTIFSSDTKLTNVNFIYGSYEKLIRAIQEDLEDFARYLYHYPVDEKRANTPMHTPEKEMLIQATNDKFTLFARAIVNKDLEFFISLEENAKYTFREIATSFKEGKIKRSYLRGWYERLYEEEISSRTLLKELAIREPSFFSSHKIIKGERFFVY